MRPRNRLRPGLKPPSSLGRQPRVLQRLVPALGPICEMAACRWLLAWIGLVICSVVTASAQAPPAGTAVTFAGAPGAPALRGHLHRPEGVGPL